MNRIWLYVPFSLANEITLHLPYVEKSTPQESKHDDGPVVTQSAAVWLYHIRM